LTLTIAFVLGAVFSLAFVGLARKYSQRTERLVYVVGLVITALIYVGFAAVGGASGQWLRFECLGVFLYGAAALGGLRSRLWLLAVGWAAHVAWDLLFHLSGAGSEYMPSWYPWFCVSFDLVMASAVLASGRRRASG
jgi:hypothetical protein